MNEKYIEIRNTNKSKNEILKSIHCSLTIRVFMRRLRVIAHECRFSFRIAFYARVLYTHQISPKSITINI